MQYLKTCSSIHKKVIDFFGAISLNTTECFNFITLITLMAINRYSSPISNKAEHFKTNSSCVFISYQSKDRADAAKVADYFLTMGIDVYFDQYDNDLRLQSQNNDPATLVNALCKGINNSSHMIVIVSPTTLESKWVPFEIGFGYDKTSVRALCLKGIPKGGLPEYLRTVKIIRDLWDLNFDLIHFKKENIKKSEEQKSFHGEHPLANVMNALIVDKY